ncbi:hypothetical protein GCM10007036_14690 [Alsobacter metallidurans]|uniref:Metal-binding protein n=1 Tax=Alsobacter metallidurans TaxID=340221 RepID=A0A917I6M9_9HYPH|nr:DUF411 domain-containing protein [Alsobacter metallidurans]GGH15006.1 hypothetical protein GCM10007036_14690 [Alsobacter metallidurans]
MKEESMPSMSRRTALAALAAAPLLGASQALSQSLPRVSVTKDPSCGCCQGWVSHLRRSGFQVAVSESADMQSVKKRLGVPDELASCHTGEVAGYVLEGHVPAAEVKRLLAEKPKARGLAVPGMPSGSPGMEVANGNLDTYEIVQFGPEGRKTFARYRGGRPA